MAEEIREHMMGHKLKDRVQEAYFLADPEELKKVYLIELICQRLHGRKIFTRRVP
jgi:hypothetical protein